MRPRVAELAVSLVMILPVAASGNVTTQAVNSVWETTFNTDARYFSWTSSRGFPATTTTSASGGSGSQLYVPTAIGLNGRPNDDWKLEFLARSGVFWSRQSSAGMTGEASGTVGSLGW